MPPRFRFKRRVARSTDPMPKFVEPMLAVSGNLPVDQSKFTFEYKWDGVRALCFLDKGKMRLQARSGTDITARYPELNSLAEAIGHHRVILDGEIVTFGENGRPSFGQLQHRMHLSNQRLISQLSVSEPVFYVLFDVIYIDGHSLVELPYRDRRRVLEDLTIVGSHWQVTPAHVGEGTAMLAAARQNQLEGLVAKRLDSPYRIGQRSDDWLKIKIIQRQEFAIAGWMPERTGIHGRIGALLVGFHDENGKLRYAGKVGTGLSAGDHKQLLQKLNTRKAGTSPFDDPVPTGALFTSRPVVAEIEFRRWPTNGLLQQAAFKGIRTDKSAKDVVRENVD